MNPDPEHASKNPALLAPQGIAAASAPDGWPADEELVRLGLAGDRLGVERLVLRHQPAVSRLLWRFVRTRHDLDDLVQETFLRMVRALPSWRAQQPFGHWVLRIATNVGRDYFRRQSVRRRWMLDPQASEDSDKTRREAIDENPNPAARAAANDVKDLLSHLAPDERTILTLHHLEGWDLRDIAQHLGCTHTATKLRAWRARRRLRALLDSKES